MSQARGPGVRTARKLLVGFAIQGMGRSGEPLLRGVGYLQKLVFRILGMIMWLAPIGAFGANHHLRQSLVFLNVPTMQQPEAYVSHVDKLFDEHGKLVNDPENSSRSSCRRSRNGSRRLGLRGQCQRRHPLTADRSRGIKLKIA